MEMPTWLAEELHQSSPLVQEASSVLDAVHSPCRPEMLRVWMIAAHRFCWVTASHPLRLLQPDSLAAQIH